MRREMSQPNLTTLQNAPEAYLQARDTTDAWYQTAENKLASILPPFIGDVVFTMTAPKKVSGGARCLLCMNIIIYHHVVFCIIIVVYHRCRSIIILIIFFILICDIITKVTIHDSVLGTIEKVLWGATIAWLSYEMFTLKQYNVVGVPDGYPQFFFERGTFNTIRNHAFGYGGQNAPWPPTHDGKAYCTAFEEGDYGPYEYIQVKKDKAGKVLSPVKDQNGKWIKSKDKFDGANYFNDDKVRCKQLNFAEIYKKDATTGYVSQTFVTVRSAAILTAMVRSYLSFLPCALAGDNLPKGDVQSGQGLCQTQATR